MGDSVLVLDFGTTNFKAAIVDINGRMSAIHRAPSPIVHPAAGRSEIVPEVFERAIGESIAALRSARRQGLDDVGAISYASQANTFALLSDAGRPLTPFIVWTDERAESFSEEVERWPDEPSFTAATGLPVYGSEFSPAKMMWLARHEPEVWSKARHICFLGDFFARLATGHAATDGGVAGMSGIFDVPRWEWSPRLCEKAGISIEALPRVERSGTSIGRIHRDFADSQGLPRSCQFVVGTLDQYAGAIGVGNDSTGGCSETTGTVLATVRSADHFDAASPIFRGPAGIADSYYHMIFGSASANLLQFLQETLLERPTFESLDAQARIDQTRLKLDPSLPPDEMMKQIRRWIDGEDIGDIVGCIYQTVANALAGQVETLFTDKPAPELIRSAGGAARSRKWLQLKANRLNRAILAPSCDEPTLLGAAILASRAIGSPFSLAAPSESSVVYPQK